MAVVLPETEAELTPSRPFVGLLLAVSHLLPEGLHDGRRDVTGFVLLVCHLVGLHDLAELTLVDVSENLLVRRVPHFRALPHLLGGVRNLEPVCGLCPRLVGLSLPPGRTKQEEQATC